MGTREFRTLQSSHYETIHLSCYNLDICKNNYFSSSVFLLTPRVVDPLSLATIADSIMVEVEDLNHYGVGLFDFCIRDIDFLARLSARSKGDGARAFRPLKSSFPKPNYCLIKFRKI